jgi:DNA polymerase-3 subunit beta
MKFTIQRETFLKPLQQVIGVVERRQTLPVLGNILVNAGKKQVKLTATDLEVELQAHVAVSVTEPGDITLPARKLLDICRTLPDEAQLDISVKNDRAVVKSGKSRFTLSTLPASEFPVVDKLKSARKFSLAQNELHTLIERTSFAMAQQDVRYYLNGLMLEPVSGILRAVATDGHRLALCQIAVDVGEAGEQQGQQRANGNWLESYPRYHGRVAFHFQAHRRPLPGLPARDSQECRQTTAGRS